MTSDGNRRILKIRNCQLADAGKVSCILPGDRASTANLTFEGKKNFIFLK